MQYAAAQVSFDRLLDLEPGSQPTFTFAHVLLPHPPYVFGADGHRLTEAERSSLSQKERFAGQARYLLGRLHDVLARLVAMPEDRRPIVIVQTDEGPNPDGFSPRFDWHDATLDQIRLKYEILSAFYLPGIDDQTVPARLTPVNTFRLVFSRYFGRDLPLLPDRIILFGDAKHPYDYEDATDRFTP
jgi:hypothetical protein